MTQEIGLVLNWILDFFFHDTFQMFEKKKNLDKSTIDCINGIYMKLESCTPSCELQKHKEATFLQLLCHLSKIDDGDEYPEEHFDFIIHLMNNLELFCPVLNETVQKMGRNISQKTFLQSMYFCLHHGKRDVAQKIYNKYSLHYDKDTVVKVERVLKSKAPYKLLLEKCCPAVYLDCMLQFLQVVYRTFPSQPFLVKMAYLFSALPPDYENRQMFSAKDVSLDPGKLSQKRFKQKLEFIKERAQKDIGIGLARHSTCSENRTIDDEPSISDSDNDLESIVTKSTHDPPDSPLLPLKKRLSNMKKRSHSASSSENEEHPRKSKFPCLTVPCLRQSLAPTDSILQRRKNICSRGRWTLKEEEDLYQAVQELGVGNWARIKNKIKSSRTNVQLKDKWRTIKTSTYNNLCEKFGPVGDS